MPSKNHISVVFDHPAAGYFTSNDTITGSVYVDVADTLSFDNIQVKLKCAESAPREEHRTYRDKRDARSRISGMSLIAKIADVDLNDVNPMYRYDVRSKVYFSTATNATSDSTIQSPSGESILEPGMHVFPFQLMLPEAVKNCPPHCPFLYNKMRFGVIWSLKAVVYRSGLNRKLRETIDVPVIPKLSQSSLSEGAHNYRVLKQSKAIRGNSLSVFKTGQQLDVTFQYPDSGLVQDRLALCKILASSPTGPMTINEIDLNIIQEIHMNTVFGLSTRKLKVEKYEVGSIRAVKVVNGPTDLSSLISDFRLKQIISPSFDGKYVHTVDYLELVINCTSEKGDVQTVSMCGPTKVLAPCGSSNPDYPLPKYQEQTHESPFDDINALPSDKKSKQTYSNTGTQPMNTDSSAGRKTKQGNDTPPPYSG